MRLTIEGKMFNLGVMVTLPQCFSALIASGCGSRCNDLKELLHAELLSVDDSTGKTLSEIYKFGKEEHPDIHKNIRQSIGLIVRSQIEGVDVFYFGEDIKDAQNIQPKQ